MSRSERPFRLPRANGSGTSSGAAAAVLDGGGVDGCAGAAQPTIVVGAAVTSSSSERRLRSNDIAAKLARHGRASARGIRIGEAPQLAVGPVAHPDVTAIVGGLA